MPRVVSWKSQELGSQSLSSAADSLTGISEHFWAGRGRGKSSGAAPCHSPHPGLQERGITGGAWSLLLPAGSSRGQHSDFWALHPSQG